MRSILERCLHCTLLRAHQALSICNDWNVRVQIAQRTPKNSQRSWVASKEDFQSAETILWVQNSTLIERINHVHPHVNHGPGVAPCLHAQTGDHVTLISQRRVTSHTSVVTHRAGNYCACSQASGALAPASKSTNHGTRGSTVTK